MKKFLVSLALGLAAAVAFAVPNPKQIEQAMEHGQWGQARAMVNEVLAAKPDSARAHLLNAATIMNIEKDVALAEQELNLAAELDKKGDVRNSRLFAKMRQDIAAAQASYRAPPVQTYAPPVVAAPAPAPEPVVVTSKPKEEGSSFLTKFFWLVVLFVVGFGVFYWFRRKSSQPELATSLSSSSTVMGSTQPPKDYQSYASSRRTYVPPAPVYVPPQQSTGPSVLETAVGVAGGVVVGNMIHDAITKPKVDEPFTRRRESDYSSSAPAPVPYFPEPAPAPSSYSSGTGSSWGDSSSYSSSTDDEPAPAPAPSYSRSSYSSSSDDDSSSRSSYSSSSSSDSSWSSSSSSDSSWGSSSDSSSSSSSSDW